MTISKVSFGAVVAVTAKSVKMKNIKNRVYGTKRQTPVVYKDVTSKYVNLPSYGTMSEAAKRGEKVCLFITNDEARKVSGGVKGWDTLDDILSNLTTCINGQKKSVSETVKKIFEYK